MPEAFHNRILDIPPRRGVGQVKTMDAQGRGEQGGFHALHRHVQMLWNGPRNRPRQPHVSPCHHPKQDPATRNPSIWHDGGVAPWGWEVSWLFHGKAGHVEDSFCRNRAVILNLP